MYASGACYEGEWARGERHGRGAMTWAGSRSRYVGGWQRGRQHGLGEHVWLAPAPTPPGDGAVGNPFLLMHNRCQRHTGMLECCLRVAEKHRNLPYDAGAWGCALSRVPSFFKGTFQVQFYLKPGTLPRTVT